MTQELHRAALGVVMPGFVGTRMPDWLGSRLAAGLAGAWIFAHNVESAEQVRTLTGQIHAQAGRALVASDEEGGTVTRLEHRSGSSWPGHGALGRANDTGLTRSVAAGLGRQAAACGVDLVAAPVADVNSEVTNPVIGVRSFGADPILVARHTTAFVRGLADGGVLSCAKHFPGHGATTQDSHVDLPRVEDSQAVVRARDLPPFAAAVAAGVDVLMTAHVAYRAWATTPATVTPALIALAREELGFEGVICTDALDMAGIDRVLGRHGGAVSALAAGVDLICLGNPAFPRSYDAEADLDSVVGAIVTAVQRGDLAQERLLEAADRVRTMAAHRVRTRPERHAPPVEDQHAPAAASASAGQATAGPATAGSADPLLVAAMTAASAALEMHGTAPTVWDRPLAVAAPGGLNLASGTGSEAVLAEMVSVWPALSRADSTQAALAHGGDLVVVTDDRLDTDRAHALLGRAAAVVHTGIGPPPGGLLAPDAVVLCTGGGGRASARAAALALSRAGGPEPETPGRAPENGRST
jgi:beta-N-acetylhexosaminidase